MKTKKLYRPVGEKEMILIIEKGILNFHQDLNGNLFFIRFWMRAMPLRSPKNGIQEMNLEITWVL